MAKPSGPTFPHDIAIRLLLLDSSLYRQDDHVSSDTVLVVRLRCASAKTEQRMCAHNLGSVGVTPSNSSGRVHVDEGARLGELVVDALAHHYSRFTCI